MQEKCSVGSHNPVSVELLQSLMLITTEYFVKEDLQGIKIKGRHGENLMWVIGLDEAGLIQMVF